ncbi:uncharacterized protein LOC127253092 isoform X2 [Andrographis paniculata]|uniref:uncharacterized protein LOC127253092 isoform X2 n=1 Tax=Andrographis paniculata TaxID=175694 RepID=UPI0021E7F8DB|nr:uncharacterized protein LOC127253092 isoform X2 [Andrographis paniculata]
MEVAVPTSPGISPLQLEDCMEELLKFTLLSSIHGKIHTGLSNEYCANLLREDPSDPLSTRTDTGGVPSHPLYKHLASSFCHIIHSGALSTAYNELKPLHEDHCIKKEDEWNKLFLEKGSLLQSMLEKVSFQLHVQEPFFSQLNDELKTVEGRCASGNYNSIQSGHLLLFNKCLILKVQDVRKYVSFHEMLTAETLSKVLPGVASIEEGVQIYRNFYSEEKESSNGVLAISVTKPTSQLYVVMASILTELSYAGVQKFLGFVETTATNPNLLPPPISTLMSAFLMPHNPDVKGSALTSGARALAKHVDRSNEKYWGTLHGSDLNKNQHAIDSITGLLTDGCWLNMHMVSPHGTVFEVRNRDGYGARWSADGSKFIGFLEPYMLDGHSNRWRH